MLRLSAAGEVISEEGDENGQGEVWVFPGSWSTADRYEYRLRERWVLVGVHKQRECLAGG